jgi:hypothetical protein
MEGLSVMYRKALSQDLDVVAPSTLFFRTEQWQR